MGILLLALILVLSIWLAVLLVRAWKESTVEMERRSRRRK